MKKNAPSADKFCLVLLEIFQISAFQILALRVKTEEIRPNRKRKRSIFDIWVLNFQTAIAIREL